MFITTTITIFVCIVLGCYLLLDWLVKQRVNATKNCTPKATLHPNWNWRSSGKEYTLDFEYVTKHPGLYDIETNEERNAGNKAKLLNINGVCFLLKDNGTLVLTTNIARGLKFRNAEQTVTNTP